jgi:DNA processing protein
LKIIKEDDEIYPKKLKQIYDRPTKLYVEGNLEILNSRSIAIIGARNCSRYGANIAYKFGYELAKRGITVISGLARGIDAYSHWGAVKAKGKTIAVLGSGLNNIYPKENIILVKEIIKNGGAIITEYEQNATPEKMHFPARNRIISALSDGILVVEARKRSGTLITVDFGIEHGKDIFCIPGNINSDYSYTTNELIKQGAIPVTRIEDIIF